MSLRTRLVLPAIAVLALAFLVGCGSSTNHATPPPSGAFSDSNLKGTYVFSIVGSDSANGFLSIVGAVTADGNGGITGGALDINDSNFTAELPNNPITGGTYNITVDGRGQAVFNTTTPFGNTIKVDFVLTSSEHGLITEFDGNGTGSGSLDLQASASQPAAGTYILSLSGISGINQATGGGIPVASAGAVTLDASGNATGSLDYNNNASSALFTINAGSSVSLATNPGTATIATSSGTLNFDVYPIDSSHMKFIETDAFPILSGELFAQTSSTFPAGGIVFTMAGLDYSVATGGPLAIGGLMTSDGTSTISNGEEDFDDVGTVDTSAPQTFAGSITASGARFLLQLTTFENGASQTIGTYTFAAYPSSGGIQLVEVDSNGVTAGVAFPQSGTSIASNEGYGLNLTAANSSGFEEDDIAEFVTTTSGLSGLVDTNDQGNTSPNQRLTGSYAMDTPATGRGVLNSNAFNGAFYVIDGSSALFLETDGTTQLGVGAFQLQNAGAKSNLAAAHMAMLRLKPVAQKAWRHR